MPDSIEVILLELLQGVTEFLPISIPGSTPALLYSWLSLPDRSEGKIHATMDTILKCHRAYLSDEKAEYGGLSVDPRYRMKNSTVIERLEIIEDECRHMNRVLIANEERLREHKKAGTNERTSHLHKFRRTLLPIESVRRKGWWRSGE